MDNFTIDIVAEGEASLEAALRIAMRHNCPGGTVEQYVIRKLAREVRYYGSPETTHHCANMKDSDNGKETLLLIWASETKGGAQKLPYPLEEDEAITFVKGWLKRADPGKTPDIDGDTGRGWRVFTEDWGHVAGCSYAVCGIQRVHALYGK